MQAGMYSLLSQYIFFLFIAAVAGYQSYQSKLMAIMAPGIDLSGQEFNAWPVE